MSSKPLYLKSTTTFLLLLCISDMQVKKDLLQTGDRSKPHTSTARFREAKFTLINSVDIILISNCKLTHFSSSNTPEEIFQCWGFFPRNMALLILVYITSKYQFFTLTVFYLHRQVTM